MKATTYTKLVSAGATLGALVTTSAARAQIGAGISATEGAADTNATDINTVIQSVINILLFIVGAASVIMLIVGGIRYVVSAGDQQAVSNAKNTILYAIVGIIVAILAYAAVQFVFNTFGGGGGEGA